MSDSSDDSGRSESPEEKKEKKVEKKQEKVQKKEEKRAKEEKKAKEGKKEKASSKRRVESDSSSDEGVVDKTPIKKSKGGNGNKVKNADGEEMIEIGHMRYVNVRNFRGKSLIDVREYYTDKASGELRPGKKGISLTKEQYQNFKAVMSEIDAKL